MNKVILHAPLGIGKGVGELTIIVEHRKPEKVADAIGKIARKLLPPSTLKSFE